MTIRRWMMAAVSLALAASTAPSSVAAATTWHVGLSGSGDGPCATPEFRAIQAAIDAAAAGDTIVVCAGRYGGPMTIEGHDKDGLTIRAAQSGTVRVLSPTKAPRTVDALVRIEHAHDVRIEGLRLVVRGARPCRWVWHAILASGDSQRAAIIGNRISVADANTTLLDRGCGYATGIGGGALVAFNIVEDWGLGQVSGTGIQAIPGSLVIGNTLRFRHPDETTYDWDDIHVGIVADRALVLGNRVLGRGTASLAGDGPGTPIMLSGIYAPDGYDAVLVGNLVRNAYAGIVVGGPDIVIGDLVQGSRSLGIDLDGPGGATVLRNVVEGSGDMDCHERSADAYEEETGEASTEGPNTWLGNIGATSDPPGLCVPR